MIASPQNCQDFRNLPSRNPQTKEDFDLINGRAQFEFYKNNCLPPLTNQEIIDKYDDKFCNAFFSSLDNNGNFIEPWSGIQNLTGAYENVSNICGFREPEQNTTPSQTVNCNIGGRNDCLTFQPEDNRTQIASWIEAQHRYINNLHIDDIRLITSYESMDSFRWNNVLRGIGNACSTGNYETIEQFEEKFQRFYNLILKAPRTPHMYAYRGIRVKEFDFFNKEQDDKIVENKGFTSLSINMNQAAFYAYNNKTNNITGSNWAFDPNLNNGKIIGLELPLGTPALFVSSRPVGDHRINPLPYNYIEGKYELVLLPHVEKYIFEDRNLNIDLTVPNNPHPLNLTTIYRYKYMSSVPLNTYFPKGINTIPSYAIIDDFITYCKNYSGANQFNNGGILYTAVIKGGFGINKLLNHRYKAINLNPTGDLDIEVCCNDQVSFNNKRQEVINLLNDFVNSIQLRFPTFDNTRNRLIVSDERSIIPNTKNVISIGFSQCGKEMDASGNFILENIIDITVSINQALFVTLNYPGTRAQILDNELSNHLGIPIKNITSYLEELKDLLRRTIYRVDQRTRDGRNPYVGANRNKGKKTIERAKTLCSIDSGVRNISSLREMCSILSRFSMKQILPRVNDIRDQTQMNNAALQLEARFGNSLNP